MRLLGTSPPRTSPPSPTRPPSRLSSCPLVFLGRLFACSAAGPARRGQIQSDLAMLRF